MDVDPHLGMGRFSLFVFADHVFLARCHYPSGPRVTSLVAIKNQPRFLKLQKEADRKGGCRRSETGKVAAGRKRQTKRWLQKEFSRKKVAAVENVGKANPRHKKKKRKEKKGGRDSGSVFFEREKSKN